MKKALLLPILILFLAGCDKGTVLDQRQSFPDMKWNRFKSVWFEFDIKDTVSTYDLVLMLRHHTVFPYPDLQVTIAVYGPEGDRRLKDMDLWVRKEDGSFKSSGMGDLWDIEQPVFQGYTFNRKGHYKVEIENRMAKYETEGVMELGLRVGKSEKK